jgi:hypothetical protein
LHFNIRKHLNELRPSFVNLVRPKILSTTSIAWPNPHIWQADLLKFLAVDRWDKILCLEHETLSLAGQDAKWDIPTVRQLDVSYEVPDAARPIFYFNPITANFQQSSFFPKHKSGLLFSNLYTPMSRVCRFGGSIGRSSRFERLFCDCQKSQQYSPSGYSFGPNKESIPTWKIPLGVLLAFIAIFCRGRWGNRAWVDLLTFFGALFAGALILLGYEDRAPEDQHHSDEVLQTPDLLEHAKNVSQKHLTYSLFM